MWDVVTSPSFFFFPTSPSPSLLIRPTRSEGVESGWSSCHATLRATASPGGHCRRPPRFRGRRDRRVSGLLRRAASRPGGGNQPRRYPPTPHLIKISFLYYYILSLCRPNQIYMVIQHKHPIWCNRMNRSIVHQTSIKSYRLVYTVMFHAALYGVVSLIFFTRTII